MSDYQVSVRLSQDANNILDFALDDSLRAVNWLPLRSLVADHTLQASDLGTRLYFDTSTPPDTKLVIPSNIGEAGSFFQVIVLGNADTTVTVTSAALRLFTGTQVITGDITLRRGGWLSVAKTAGTAWYATSATPLPIMAGDGIQVGTAQGSTEISARLSTDANNALGLGSDDGLFAPVIAGPAGSAWHIGSGPPQPSEGVDGDFYLDGDTGEIYQKVSGSWTDTGDSIEGPKGDQGDPGSKWFIGSGAPQNSEGNDGDFYLDGTTGEVYQKASGSWSDTGNSIQGPKGDKGDTGDKGDKGDKGDTGAPGQAVLKSFALSLSNNPYPAYLDDPGTVYYNSTTDTVMLGVYSPGRPVVGAYEIAAVTGPVFLQTFVNNTIHVFNGNGAVATVSTLTLQPGQWARMFNMGNNTWYLYGNAVLATDG